MDWPIGVRMPGAVREYVRRYQHVPRTQMTTRGVSRCCIMADAAIEALREAWRAAEAERNELEMMLRLLFVDFAEVGLQTEDFAEWSAELRRRVKEADDTCHTRYEARIAELLAERDNWENIAITAAYEAERQYDENVHRIAMQGKAEAEAERLRQQCDRWRYLAEKATWCFKEGMHLLHYHNPNTGSWFPPQVIERWDQRWRDSRLRRYEEAQDDE